MRYWSNFIIFLNFLAINLSKSSNPSGSPGPPCPHVQSPTHNLQRASLHPPLEIRNNFTQNRSFPRYLPSRRRTLYQRHCSGIPPLTYPGAKFRICAVSFPGPDTNGVAVSPPSRISHATLFSQPEIATMGTTPGGENLRTTCWFGHGPTQPAAAKGSLHKSHLIGKQE